MTQGKKQLAGVVAGWRSRARLTRIVSTLVLGWLGAQVALLIRSPLPWMIGPMLAVAIGSMAGRRQEVPGVLRNGGQIVLGTAMGLYFTPAMLNQSLALAPWIALNVALIWLMGVTGAWLLMRFSGVDPITAYYCMSVGGGSEMTILAERAGGRPERVAAAHTLRVVLVVLIIPLVYKLADVHGFETAYALAAAREVHWDGMVVLLAFCLVVTLLLERLNLSYVWVIAPLVTTAFITASGFDWSVLPVGLVNAAQLVLGIGMGSRFTPEFLKSAPRFMLCVLGTLAIMLLLSAGLGVFLGFVTGVDLPTAILATAPGGVTEMSLTARVLQLGVATVTVFQVSRMMLLVLCTGPAYRIYKPLFVKPAVPTPNPVS